MTINPLIAIAALVAFLAGMIVHSVYYRYASGKPLRLLVRQAVRSATDWFFEHIILIRPNRFLEYVSASGLLALLAGKIVILFAGYWYEIASTTGYIAACTAVAGFWQFRAVVKRDNEERLRAAFAALWAWSSVLVVMMYHFFHTDAATLARLILEFVVPLSVVFWFVNFVQMWVLMRYAMYPEKPREIMFFYAVLTQIENRFADVFKIPRELQASINADVQEIAEEMQIGTR